VNTRPLARISVGGNVHADVQALISAGLLDVSKAGVRVEYDSIETKIAM